MQFVRHSIAFALGSVRLFLAGLVLAASAGFLSGCFNGELSFSDIEATSTSQLQLQFVTPAVNSSFKAGEKISPAPTVTLVNLQSRVQTSRSDTVELRVYKDSSCSQTVDSTITVSAQNGVAIFRDLLPVKTGIYYVKAQVSFLDGTKLSTACKGPFTVRAGTIAELVPVNSGLQAAEVGATASFSVRSVDEFRNTLVPDTAIPVNFAPLSAGLPTPSPSSIVTDATGTATVSVALPAAAVPIAVMKVSSASFPLGSFLYPIWIDASSAATTQFSVEGYPNQVIKGDDQPLWFRLSAMDSNQIPRRNFASTVQLANTASLQANNASNGRPSVTYSGSQFGTQMVSLGLGAIGDVISGLRVYINGSDTQYSQPVPVPTPSAVVPSSECGASKTFSSAGTVQWQTAGSHWTPTAVPTALDSVTISSGTANIVSNPTALVGCAYVDSNLVLQAGATLVVSKADMLIRSSGTLSASSATLKFSRGSAGAQRFSFSGKTMNLGVLEVMPPTGADYNYAFYLNGGMSADNFTATGSVVANEFKLNAGGGAKYRVYINTNVTVFSNLSIPANVEVIVNPGAQLTVLSGTVISGILTIRGGGKVIVAESNLVQVSPGGKLVLSGTPTHRAELRSENSNSRFAVLMNGDLYASFFTLSGLGAESGAVGLDLRNGSAKVFDGVFENLDRNNPTIALADSVSINACVLYGLHFKDPSGNLSSSSQLINANLGTTGCLIGIIQSELTTTAETPVSSLKSRVTDPSNRLIFDKPF